MIRLYQNYSKKIKTGEEKTWLVQNDKWYHFDTSQHSDASQDHFIPFCIAFEFNTGIVHPIIKPLACITSNVMAQVDDCHLKEDPVCNHQELLALTLSWPSQKQSNSDTRKQWKVKIPLLPEGDAKYVSFLHQYYHPHHPLRTKKVNLNKIVRQE